MDNNREEEVGKLNGTPAVDRAYTQEETKLFRRKAVLTYLDGPVYDFDLDRVEFENPVPVYGSDMKKLGFAMVSVEDNRILADITIDYSTEERLLAETGSTDLFPRFFGRMGVPAMALFDFQAPTQVLQLMLDGIQLSPDKPADPRLGRFGDPVL